MRDNKRIHLTGSQKTKTSNAGIIQLLGTLSTGSICRIDKIASNLLYDTKQAEGFHILTHNNKNLIETDQDHWNSTTTPGTFPYPTSYSTPNTSKTCRKIPKLITFHSISGQTKRKSTHRSNNNTFPLRRDNRHGAQSGQQDAPMGSADAGPGAAVLEQQSRRRRSESSSSGSSSGRHWGSRDGTRRAGPSNSIDRSIRGAALCWWRWRRHLHDAGSGARGRHAHPFPPDRIERDAHGDRARQAFYRLYVIHRAGWPHHRLPWPHSAPPLVNMPPHSLSLSCLCFLL